MIELKTEGQSSSILSSIGSVPPTSTNREQGTAAAVASKAPGLSVSEKDKLLAQYGCEEYEGEGVNICVCITVLSSIIVCTTVKVRLKLHTSSFPCV